MDPQSWLRIRGFEGRFNEKNLNQLNLAQVRVLRSGLDHAMGLLRCVFVMIMFAVARGNDLVGVWRTQVLEKMMHAVRLNANQKSQEKKR